MTPIEFPQANVRFGPPEGMAESQVRTVHAYQGRVIGGTLDGSDIAVTAWQPSPEELTALQAGGPLYLSFLGGLPPHFPTTDFEFAAHLK